MDAWLRPADAAPVRLHAAIRYAVLGGGKRVRPLLVYAAGETLGVAPERVDPIAVSLELLHAYSLVHDDLPAMDDDELRRGRPTTHVAYDEATAVLVGDTLQTEAYSVLLNAPAYAADPALRVRLMRLLAEASGSAGMAGGQAMDLAAEGHWLAAAELETMYRLKTGRLIEAAIRMPCACAGELDESSRGALDRFADNIGLAFQITDDVLDVTGATEVIGKPSGSDQRHNKATYPALFGLDVARRRVAELSDAALGALEQLGERAAPLRWMAGYLLRRDF